ncbi:MAG TPA: cobyric acid synthase CobQ [Eubacteriaceae bacterium]|nr:cobyric acid synthase CobQ [Eubacteriaceae bacterium]
MKKPNIMFQGTGSSVGKSILTAGFCRVLADRGIGVAPFKSQNMALNSFIIKDQKEMGRAQVVQAEAARMEPKVEMNPILLKPSSDVGSQVIIMGEVYKNMKADEYHAFKPKLREIVREAYESLESEVEAIVIEGAGSPAEINLRENDLVNMGLAELIDAPVVLIGDIDRGGVFASIYGTYMLLTEEERARIKGFVINKFRGDVDLLRPGIQMLEEKINIPCLGVVPYFAHHIDDEDSVSNRFDAKDQGEIRIGIVRLPHISNFTDFTPFEMEADVTLTYIENPGQMKDLDFLILPGSKNTIEDMHYLEKTGLKEGILKTHAQGVPVFGICGGYQILGEKIIDPNQHESEIAEIRGLGLLEMDTIISPEKRTVQVKGTLAFDLTESFASKEISGYEIHMGVTTKKREYMPFALLNTGEEDGVVAENASVIGTYLHGVFDNEEPRRAILNQLRKKKGLQEKTESEKYDQFKEKEYERLKEQLEQHLEMDKIYEIMGF